MRISSIVCAALVGVASPAIAGTVQLGNITLAGQRALNPSTLSAEAAAKVVMSNFTTLRQCYKGRKSDSDERLHGTLVLTFDVMPNGTVDNLPKVSGVKELEKCVTLQLYDLRFRPPKDPSGTRIRAGFEIKLDVEY